MSNTWIVGVARPLCDLQIDMALSRFSVDVYVPLYRRILRGVRINADGRRVRTRGLGSTVLRPLISPYLFIKCDSSETLRLILNTQGLVRILRQIDGTPVFVPERIITEFRKFVANYQPRDQLLPGDSVRIGYGALEGHTGIVINIDDRGTTRLNIEIMGRLVRTEIEADIPLRTIPD